jgi:hypothetical protein
MTSSFLDKISNVIHKLVHDDLFDGDLKYQRKSSSKHCKKGKCCCKHRSSRSKKEVSEPKHTYSYPSIPQPTKPISNIKPPCHSCNKKHLHPQPIQHSQEPIHEHHHHEHYHQEHRHQEHEHHHHQEHENEHHQEHEHYHEYDHHDHEHKEHHQEINHEQENMDEEYRRFYYQVLPQMNIQKSVQPQESLENEIDHAIQYSQYD